MLHIFVNCESTQKGFILRIVDDAVDDRKRRNSVFIAIMSSKHGFANLKDLVFFNAGIYNGCKYLR